MAQCSAKMEIEAACSVVFQHKLHMGRVVERGSASIDNSRIQKKKIMRFVAILGLALVRTQAPVRTQALEYLHVVEGRTYT